MQEQDCVIKLSTHVKLGNEWNTNVLTIDYKKTFQVPIDIINTEFVNILFNGRKFGIWKLHKLSSL